MRSILQSQIEALSDKTRPMHMPGHKRVMRPSDILPYEWDITEIEGADDLHDANGILKDAMDRASALWKSRRTWFLVGGSTCGLLAAIRAAAPFGSEIIAARNCHRSVYHAIELGGYKVHWMMPPEDKSFDVCLSITPEQVQASLRKYPESACVIVTSPTYEGVVSDIRSIAGLCHRAEIPLVVDEAHGAHLGLFEEGGFPESAVQCGADLVVQSVHKTLPSMTQTAVLHMNGTLVREKEVERQLAIFETSSPSYPLMISIDSCVEMLREYGAALFAQWKDILDRFYKRAAELHLIRVWNPDLRQGRGKSDIVRDRGKILINFRNAGITGAQAARLLREQYGIETEMASGCNVLAMTSCADTEKELGQLADAMQSLDKALSLKESAAGRTSAIPSLPPVHTACTILQAVSTEHEDVPMEESEGRICAEYLYAYPPGIPILAPGEYIKKEHLEILKQMETDGNRIHHTVSEEPDRITCLAE